MGDLARVLDVDSLQEVLLRCNSDTLIAVMQTCKYMYGLISSNPLVWKTRLWEDFGWEPEDPEDSSGDSWSYRDIYCSFQSIKDSRFVRFRGLYTNGGIDGDNEEYWLDNAFKGDHSPYCSNGSSNVDIVGVLLDDYDEQDNLEQGVRAFMREKCYTAAEWLIHLNQTRGQNTQMPNGILSVDQLNDLQLKSFFCSLFESYNQGSPLGFFLFADVAGSHQEEERRIQDTVALLHQQENERRNSVTGITSDTKFDRMVLSHIRSGRLSTCSVDTIEIGRIGQLTCPISSGVVFGCRLPKKKACFLDDKLLKSLSDSFDQLRLFDNLNSPDTLLEKSIVGIIPKISHVTIMKRGSVIGGCFIEFRKEKMLESCHDFRWHPLGWFSFDPNVSQRLKAFEILDVNYVTPSGVKGIQDDQAIQDVIVCSLNKSFTVNFLAVKLIDQENLMEQMLDDHNHPNIDISSIKVGGRVLKCPSKSAFLLDADET